MSNILPTASVPQQGTVEFSEWLHTCHACGLKLIPDVEHIAKQPHSEICASILVDRAVRAEIEDMARRESKESAIKHAIAQDRLRSK